MANCKIASNENCWGGEINGWTSTRCTHDSEWSCSLWDNYSNPWWLEVATWHMMSNLLSVFFHWFCEKNSSWNCLHGVSWSCSFPIKCKILKYDHTEIVIQGQTVPNAIYLNTAQNVQSYIIEEWLNLSVGYNCNKVCHHCRVMTESSLQPPSQLVGRPLHTLQSFLAECIKHGPRSSSRTISISLNSMSLNFSQLWSLKKNIYVEQEKIKHHTMSPGHPYTMRSTMWSSCIFTPYDQMVCDAHTESWCRPLDLRKLHAKHSWRLWLVGRPGYYHQRWSPCPCIWKI